jgi:hypothetical protein
MRLFRGLNDLNNLLRRVGGMDFFLIQLLCSFAAGALVVGGSTWIAERFQNRWGGFIAAIPTTTAVSLIFIAWTQGVDFAARAANVTPAAVAGGMLFALIFVKTVLRGGDENDVLCGLKPAVSYANFCCAASFHEART